MKRGGGKGEAKTGITRPAAARQGGKAEQTTHGKNETMGMGLHGGRRGRRDRNLNKAAMGRR